MHACACFITSVFVYVYMRFITECIYLGIVFINDHVWVFIFCFDYIVSPVHIEKEKKRKKIKTVEMMERAVCMSCPKNNIHAI